jgi:hypothetical protein
MCCMGVTLRQPACAVKGKFSKLCAGTADLPALPARRLTPATGNAGLAAG